jgi:putative transposase
MNNDIFKRAPHNPPHLFLPNTMYMLTASIYQKEPLIASPKRKMEWINSFRKAAQIYGWQIIAWVILHNHYHAIVQSPDQAATLSKFVGSYHKFTARIWNSEDNSNGQKVWWNYWDRCVRDESDYYVKLRYVFWNPVKHGLVSVPEEYEFSNYREFLSQWQAEFDFTNMDEVSDVPEF